MHGDGVPRPGTKPAKTPIHALCLCQTMMSSLGSPLQTNHKVRRDNPSFHNVIDPPRRRLRRAAETCHPRSFSFAKASENLRIRTCPAKPMAKQDGGARRDRTDDLMLAKHALYQLSYGPLISKKPGERSVGAFVDLTSVRPRCHPSTPRLRRMDVLRSACAEEDGGPRQTRTADLTLIRRVL